MQVESIGPLAQARVHAFGSARRRGEEVRAVIERTQQPVVRDVARLVEREDVAGTARGEVVDPAGEHRVGERARVAPRDQEPSQRSDVHQPDAFAHRQVLLAPVAVGERSLPAAGPPERRSRGHVDVVQTGPLLDHLVDRCRERLKGDRPNGRARGGTCPRSHVGHVGAIAREAGECPSAHRASARTHRRGGVALQDLGRAVPLGPRLLQVVHRDVLAQTQVAAAEPRLVSIERRVPHDPDRFVDRHPRELVARRESHRQHQRVARDPASFPTLSNEDRANPPPSVRFDQLPVHDRLGLPRHLVDEGRGHDRGDHRRPRHDQRVQVFHPLDRRGDDDDPAAGRDAVQRGHRRRRPPEPDAREVVAREERMQLGGARCDHDASRVHLHQLGRTRERHRRTLEQAERRVAFEDLDGGVRSDDGLELTDRVERGTGRDAGADGEQVAQGHALAARRGFERGGQAGGAGADHDRVAPNVPRDRARDRCVDRERPGTRRSADQPLGHRPGEPRSDEGLRQEPDRHERMQEVGDVQQVVLGRRPAAVAPHPHPTGGERDAGADARNAVDRDGAVRALAGPAVQAAATVRLQRARERAHAGSEERGCDGVAFEDRDLAPFEPQRLPRHPIRFVLVSRVTVNHVRHPNAWNQRSRCGPSAFSGTRTRGRSVPASRGTWGRSSPPNANSVCGREPQFGQGTCSVTSAAASGP